MRDDILVHSFPCGGAIHLREIGVTEPLWWVFHTTPREGRTEFEGDVFWDRAKAEARFAAIKGGAR